MSAFEMQTTGRHVYRHAHALVVNDALSGLAEPVETGTPFSKLPTEIVAMIARAVLIKPEEIDISNKRNRKCPPLYLVSRDLATISLKFANYFRDNTFVFADLQEPDLLARFFLRGETNPLICKIVVEYPWEAINRTSSFGRRSRGLLDMSLCVLCDDKSSFKRDSNVVRLRPTLAGNSLSPSELTSEMVWINQAMQVSVDRLMTRPCSQRWLQPFLINQVVNTATVLWHQDQALQRARDTATQSNTKDVFVDPDEIAFQRWKSNLDMEKHAAHMRRLRTFK